MRLHTLIRTEANRLKMFNPIFNADGSLSYFRVTCLIVALGCLIGGCVMDGTSDSKSEDGDSSVASVTQNEDSVPEADDSLSADEIRIIALKEVYQTTKYMQTCGAIDRGYDNCSVSLSEKANPYFTLSQDTATDGFSLRFNATDNNSDTCRVFETDSNGTVTALNSKGEEDPSCAEALDKALKQFTITRDTDADNEQLAPSGFTPIVRNISQR